jgi:WLM domain
MDTDAIGQGIVIIGTLFLGYLIYDKYMVGNLEYVKSTVDGREYLVQALPDKQAAADLLARIGNNLETLIHHLEKTAAGDPRVVRIVTHFNRDALSEGVDSDSYTSYSVNKGEKIVFCLRAKNAQKTLEDINMMMFVAIHELAHIASEDIGHTPEFWANFKWLLENAVNIGIYTKQDFEKKPREYCGMTVHSSVI